MKIEIQEEKNNPLLNRRELKVKIIHDGPTPTRKDVISKLKAVTTARKETVIVKSFHSKFGARESSGIVRIYDSKKRAMEIEPRFMLEKNLIGEKEGTEGKEGKEEKQVGGGKPAKEHPKESAKPEKKEEKPKKEVVKEKKKVDKKQEKTVEKERKVEKKDVEKKKVEKKKGKEEEKVVEKKK